MKVLVTGATGFLGRYVVERLILNNCSLITTSRSEKVPDEWLLHPLHQHFKFDLENFDHSVNYFEYFDKPDILIHLAWQGLPNYKALFHFERNLQQQYFFLKNLVINGLSYLTVTGTCLEYGMQEGCLKEDMPVFPANAYALAKHTLHTFLLELKKTKSFDLNWLRLFYTFGKGQSPASLYAQLSAALENGDESFNMSGGEQERDFLPVEKVAESIVKIALRQQEIGLINICSGNPVKIKDWVNDLIKSKNKKININLGYYPYPDYEPMFFWGDNNKLKVV